MSSKKTSLGALTLAAFGVVYGDIGTSVLYALRIIFKDGHVAFNPSNMMGVLSLIFWTITVVVSLKYVWLVIRADNHGEGGLVAMQALAARTLTDQPRLRRPVLLLGLFGTALFFGDGVITPAISVLSAVEGLAVLSPSLSSGVIPITLVVLFALFASQRHGTAHIRKLFGPIMLLWFLCIGALGAWRIGAHPEILFALDPRYALAFAWVAPSTAFVLLGAVVLCVAGAEALYADLGHFGRKPIRLAWFSLVMPALTLNYFGQGAYLLSHPGAVSNPFFMMAPSWALAPLVALATVATVIASQALITGAFSVTKQAVQLGFLPRLRMIHTNVREAGQIYIPVINWGLFVAIIGAVLVFRSSDALASAYGLTVTLNMLITTTLTFFVIRHAWKYPLWLCLAATGFFCAVDVLFFTSNLLKIFEGGLFPLFIGASVFLLMKTWCDGRARLADKQLGCAVALLPFLGDVCSSHPTRVEGTAVFFSPHPETAPTALLSNLKHNKVLHERNLFVTVEALEVPWVGRDRRVEVVSLGHCCWSVKIRFGFKNDFDVPRALARMAEHGCLIDPMSTSYFLSRDIVVPRVGVGMSFWRETLFVHMHRNAHGASEFFRLPPRSVVELGSKIDL